MRFAEAKTAEQDCVDNDDHSAEESDHGGDMDVIDQIQTNRHDDDDNHTRTNAWVRVTVRHIVRQSIVMSCSFTWFCLFVIFFSLFVG